MEKLEVLEVLSLIKDSGCCNMFDRNCLVRALKLTGEHKIANHLENMTSLIVYFPID